MLKIDDDDEDEDEDKINELSVVLVLLLDEEKFEIIGRISSECNIQIVEDEELLLEDTPWT